MADQPGILDRGLTVLYRLAINGVADHLDESGDAWIFGDEAVVPPLLRWSNQHQFESALPHNPSSEPLENRPALAPICRIGLCSARLAAIGIGSLLAQPHQVQHVDRARPIVLPELREHVLGRIDMAHELSYSLVARLLARRHEAPNGALTFA